MSDNPYESPLTDSLPQPVEPSSVRTRWRLTVAILLVPAIYNYVSFCREVCSGVNSLPYHDAIVWTSNGVMLAMAAAAGWFLGLPALAWVSRLVHRILQAKSSPEDWQHEFNAMISSGPALAAVGAVVWAVWVFTFYEFEAPFMVASVPAAILGHLCGAALYLPLFFRWYRLESAAQHRASLRKTGPGN